MRQILLVLALLGCGAVFAVSPYSEAKFKEAQKAGHKILLHFHADWCPVCQVQKTNLERLEKAGELTSIKFFSVDYDKAKSLNTDLKVKAQSTLVSFLGRVENGRVSGITTEKGLKAFIDKSLVSVSLGEQLKRMQQASKLPTKKRKIMEAAAEKLRRSQIAKKAPKLGETLKDFSLPNSKGKSISLRELRAKGPVIVTFYRGSWCPYCNVQLNSYQAHLGAFSKRGAKLVAITPEIPDLTAETTSSRELGFDILTDKDNRVAKQLGLVFGVTPALKKLYQEFGIDLEKSQGNSEWELPVPATFVINRNGKIIYAFVDTDYKKRADPEAIVSALDKLI